MLSLIIPAHNEERWLGATLEAAKAALDGAGIAERELIVVDDASTDRTADIAREHDVKVVASDKRNIAATRNAGAAASTGERLLFVDADTIVSAAALEAVMRAFDGGTIGGGARLKWDRSVRLSADLVLHGWNMLSSAAALPAGGFFFARRDAFERIGGFDESIYVSEEIWLGLELHKLGPVRIIEPKVVTSARKIHTHSVREFLSLFARLAHSPRRTLRDREALDLWYVRRH